MKFYLGWSAIKGYKLCSPIMFKPKVTWARAFAKLQVLLNGNCPGVNLFEKAKKLV